MDFRRLLLAHGAFYKYEKRAKFYDVFMNNKQKELGSQSKLPIKEVIKLFKFIRQWDFHFTGIEELFIEAYEKNYAEIEHLKGKNFYEIDVLERDNHVCIQNIINAFATCNESGRYESTDASKIAHAMNPEVFVMWDQKIREGVISGNYNRAENYVMNFLPRMKKCLDEEIIGLIESICGNRNITKLLDQCNYMSYTMSVEFNVYLKEVEKNAAERVWTKSLEDSLDFWKAHVRIGRGTDKGEIQHIMRLLDELKKFGNISPKDWREYLSKWKKGSQEDKEIVREEIESMKERLEN